MVLVVLALVLALLWLLYTWQRRRSGQQDPCKCAPKEVDLAPREHAVIIGCGMAGMVGAAMLSRHFKKVTILERFKLPEGATRSGCSRGRPQCQQVHGLLKRGQLTVEYYLPGFSQEVAEGGGSFFEWLSTWGWSFGGKMNKPNSAPASPLNMLVATRALYDLVIQKRIAQLPNVEIIPEAKVESLVMEGLHCRGVRARVKTEGGVEAREIMGDIVVNCSGRNGGTQAWIKEAFESQGMVMPPYTTEVRKDCLHYASALFRQGDAPEPTFGALFEQPDWYHGVHKGCLYQPTGSGLTAMIRYGYGPGINLQSSNESAKEWVADLHRAKEFEEILEWEQAEPWLIYHDTPQHFRHFEEMDIHLENFYNIGAAVTKLDPSYGQGMTQAVSTVKALEFVLVSHWHSSPFSDYCGTSRAVAERVAEVSFRYYHAGSDNVLRPFVEAKSSLKGIGMAYLMHHTISHMFDSVEGSEAFSKFVHGVVDESAVLRPKWVLPALLDCANDAIAAVKKKYLSKPGAPAKND